MLPLQARNPVGNDQTIGLTALPIEVRDRLAAAERTYGEVGATAGDLPGLITRSDIPCPSVMATGSLPVPGTPWASRKCSSDPGFRWPHPRRLRRLASC